MNTIFLYRVTTDKKVKLTYGFGNDKHDYGKGFYQTENIDLAKEWAVYRPEEINGYVYKFILNLDGLKVLDFRKYNVLVWFAELMKYRHTSNSKRYKMLSEKFINNFINKDKYIPVEGETIDGFAPDWIGEFYAYYQWYYNMASSDVIKKVPLDFLKKAYYELHDLELNLAVKKGGQ